MLDHQSASSLSCAEDHSGDGDDVVSHTPPSPPSYTTPPPLLDESVVDRLLDSEPFHVPLPNYLLRCRQRFIDLTARQDSINWIFKVHEHHQFRPVTAFLSVNYLDRFLSIRPLPKANSGWPFQLLSVACLSLASKMEELYVPLLIDLQVGEPKFVFDPKTVLRMELCVMATLNWRLHPVTPFDYLDYFISKLPCYSGSRPDSFANILSASYDLVLNTTRAIDFLGFLPSVIAAAAVTCAAADGGGDVAAIFYDRVNKEMVRSCQQLMEEYLIDTCPSAESKFFPAQPERPPSPVGVLDAAACVSCGSGSSKPPGLANKRARSSPSGVQEQPP